MKQLILKWLTNILDPWFVTLEDFELIQELRCSAEHEIRRLLLEQQDLLNSIYDRKYKGFELTDDQVSVDRMSYEDIQLREIGFRWEIRIPVRRFLITWSITKELKIIENEVANRLAENFKQLVSKQLFKPNAKLLS